MCGALPFVPAVNDLGIYPFSILFCLLLASSILRFIKNPVIDKTSALIVAFLTYLTINYWIAALYNTSFLDWLRGLAPFLFFTAYIFARQADDDEGNTLYHAIWLACVVWLIRMTILVGSAIQDLATGAVGRLSHISTDTLVPFGMVGFILTLYDPQSSGRKKFVFSSLFFVAVILAGYRSQILMCCAILAIWAKLYYPTRILMAAPLLSALAVYLARLELSILDSIAMRFSNIANEKGGVRDNELQYAIKNFLESPLIGKGLSYPIPVGLTRDATMADLLTSDYVRYMHNIIGYFLMNTGIVGTLFLFAIWTSGFIAIFKQRRKFNKDYFFSGIAVAWICLSVFFLVSASYRQIQTIFIFSTMLFLLTSSHKRSDP